MTITTEQVDQWLKMPSETQRLEFKEAKTQFDNKRLYRYCVALANEGGGHLVLGVSDKKPRKVVGTRAFNNPVEMESKLFTALGFRVHIEEVGHPDGRVLVFVVPSRPRGTAWHYEGAYLMRSGSQLVPMSEDQLRGIFTEGQPCWLEETARENATGQEVVQLLDTQAYFKLLKLPYPTGQKGVLSRLLEERLISQNGKGYDILNIGALLFANSLRSFPGVQRKAVRVIRYEDISKSDTRSDITWDKGYAMDFDGLILYVMSQLPQKEVIEIGRNVSIKLVDEIAIRELLANALIHQDMMQSGMWLMVEVYANRVEISNPGESLVPVERFIDRYQSRNERLTDLMRRFNICEERSSGIDKVIQSVEFHQLPAPMFRSDLNRTTVTVFGPRDFADMSSRDRVRACYQHCVLQWVMGESMNNQSLRQRFGLSGNGSSSSKVSQVIAASVKRKLIRVDPESTGTKRYIRYLPAWA